MVSLIRGANRMIVESLLGLSLVLRVSLDAQPPAPPEPATWAQMAMGHKDATLLPLVQRATNCILRKSSADPRYSRDIRADELNDVIIDSIEACMKPVRAMINAHDRLYGSGSGEAFLLGPYLDVLPSAVVKQVNVKFKQ
jgi:hypothetical protein